MVTRVTVVEVGPRDGLQSEPLPVSTAAKVAFIEALADAGLTVIEATSFVNPAAVPQMADAADVLSAIRRRPGVSYPVLVPNERGLDRALAAGADAISLFTSATEAFARANVRASIDETFVRFAPVVTRAMAAGLRVRGYVSVALGCPYSGAVEPTAVAAVAARLLDLGCDEVCLADTIGSGDSDEVARLLDAVLEVVPLNRLAMHFHDTGGRAIANVEAALRFGVTIFDAAAGGLGGCPFAPGAPGNLATETLLDHLAERNIATGVDREAVAAAVAVLRRGMSLPAADSP